MQIFVSYLACYAVIGHRIVRIIRSMPFENPLAVREVWQSECKSRAFSAAPINSTAALASKHVTLSKTSPQDRYNLDNMKTKVIYTHIIYFTFLGIQDISII